MIFYSVTTEDTYVFDRKTENRPRTSELAII